MKAPMSTPIEVAPGCRLYRGHYNREQQQRRLAEIRLALEHAPLFQPRMPRTGKPFSVRMSNMGQLGWLSDSGLGYRYETAHPETRRNWPPIPDSLLQLWRQLVSPHCRPEACLINYYDAAARMGLHKDTDEQADDVPLLSVSLGDSARFRLGGLTRRDPTRSFELRSGDVLVMGPPRRLAYHGVDRIIGGSSRLLPEGGRFNLTLRRVRPVAASRQTI